MLLRREHRCLDLIEIGQRLEDHEIGTRLRARDHHLTEELIGVLERERAERLNELTDRTDVERNAHARNAGVLCCTACRAHILSDDLGDGLARPLELVSVRTEGIAVDDAAARRNIVPMDLLDHLGMIQAEELGALARRESARLQLCAHASV